MKVALAGGLLAAVIAAAAAGPAAAAPDIANLAAAYGARPAAWGVRMSPSGDKLLFFTASGDQGTAVVTIDIPTGKRAIILASEKASTAPSSCTWKSESRVLCRVYFLSSKAGTRLGFNRTLSIAADGSSRMVLGQRTTEHTIGVDQSGARLIDLLPDDPDHVLMNVFVPESSDIGSLVVKRGGGLSVQKVEVATGRMTMVERPRSDATGFDSDNQGHVRFMSITDRDANGYLRDRSNYLVRPAGSKEWRSFHRETLSDTNRFAYLGFDESGASMLIACSLDGRLALFRDPVDANGGSELLFAHPAVDVDGVLRIGKGDRPVAAYFTVDATEYSYFDPVLAKRHKALSNALPGKPPVAILDESWDRQRNLLFAGGVSDPGTYYRYDAGTKQLAPLLPVRPGVAGFPAGIQSVVRYKADDGVDIPAYLTAPAGPAAGPRPAIIMPHGGPESRDSLGFDWLVQFYVQLGYVVLQPNFRGSSGYGEAWFAKNGFKSWATAIGDINAGARWLAAQGIGDPGRTAIVGWSYGGYAALQADIVAPSLYKAVVAIAPVTDLAQLKTEAQEFTNFKIVANFVGDGPHVDAGSPSRGAARIGAPVLLVHGDQDQNVDIAQSRTMAAALKRAGKPHDLIVYPGLAHDLDDSRVRTDMLKRSAEWLAAAMPR